MLILKKNPTLVDYQNYVRQLETERGFQNEDAVQKCLLLGEEVGEFYEAVTNPGKESIDEELADMIIVLCTIANRYDINLEEQLKNNDLGGKLITFPALQNHIKISEEYKKVQGMDILKLCIILGQLIGKLHKAIRKQNKVTRIDYNSKFIPIKDALTKIIWSLCQIADRYNINLEQAFRNKEDLNKKRIWQ